MLGKAGNKYTVESLYKVFENYLTGDYDLESNKEFYQKYKDLHGLPLIYLTVLSTRLTNMFIDKIDDTAPAEQAGLMFRYSEFMGMLNTFINSAESVVYTTATMDVVFTKTGKQGERTPEYGIELKEPDIIIVNREHILDNIVAGKGEVGLYTDDPEFDADEKKALELELFEFMDLSLVEACVDCVRNVFTIKYRTTYTVKGAKYEILNMIKG